MLGGRGNGRIRELSFFWSKEYSLIVKALYTQNDDIAGLEIRVCILVRITAHTHRPVRKIVEDTARAFAGDHRPASAAGGMAGAGAVVGIWLGLLDGDVQFPFLRVAAFHDAAQFRTRMIEGPQIRDGRIAQLPLGAV